MNNLQAALAQLSAFLAEIIEAFLLELKHLRNIAYSKFSHGPLDLLKGNIILPLNARDFLTSHFKNSCERQH